MLNTSSNKIILKIPVSHVTVRFNGQDRKVIEFGDGFVDAEYEDGSVFPVSNPLKLWVIDRDTNKSANVHSNGVVYFELVAKAPASNPATDDGSVTGDEFSLNSVS